MGISAPSFVSQARFAYTPPISQTQRRGASHRQAMKISDLSQSDAKSANVGATKSPNMV